MNAAIAEDPDICTVSNFRKGRSSATTAEGSIFIRGKHRMNRDPVSGRMTMLIEVERHTNCTVVICQDDQTGEYEVAWYDNNNPPVMILTGEDDE